MKPQDVFAVAVRIAGLIGLFYIISTSLMFIGAGVPLPLVVRSIIFALIFLWMIRGAPQRVRFAYHSE